MNKYRAILVDPGNTTAARDSQIFGNDRAEIDVWAEKVLVQAVSPDAAVIVYRNTEVRDAIIPKKKPEELKP